MAEGWRQDTDRSHAWREVLAWHLLTSVLGAIAAAIWTIATVVFGDPGGPDVAWGGTPDGVSGAWPALLVLKRTTGDARYRQRDLERQQLVMWRGPGTTVSGHFWLSGGALMWAPVDRWRGLGAHEIRIPLETARTEVTNLPTGSYGLVVRPDVESEVWLWIRGSRSTEAVKSLRGLRPT